MAVLRAARRELCRTIRNLESGNRAVQPGSISQLPFSLPGESPMQRTPEDRFSGLNDLQERAPMSKNALPMTVMIGG
jgi:hypothetical protein